MILLPSWSAVLPLAVPFSTLGYDSRRGIFTIGPPVPLHCKKDSAINTVPNEPQALLLENQRPIALWLLVCCAMIFTMVVLGGVTRLTGSGLSMVEWEPIMGVVPPLTQTDWQSTFEKYQQFPEFRIKNRGMDLSEFKTIFWFEFGHRLLGRAIGVVFLIPFLYFLIRRRIDRALTPKLVIMFCLGGLQGLLGWYMVKSGLVDNPHVSQYRLTAHLAAAFLIYGYMFWVAMDLLFLNRETTATELKPIRRFSWAVTALTTVTVLSGGFVAGLKAGFAYNTFPLMDGHWFPEAYFYLQPWWMNLFENIAAVQFDHRLLAILTLVLIATGWWLARGYELPKRAQLGFHLLSAMVMVQVTLGIFTLLLHVPVSLAATHQGGALMLFTIALFTNHALKKSARF